MKIGWFSPSMMSEKLEVEVNLLDKTTNTTRTLIRKRIPVVWQKPNGDYAVITHVVEHTIPRKSLPMDAVLQGEVESVLITTVSSRAEVEALNRGKLDAALEKVNLTYEEILGTE